MDPSILAGVPPPLAVGAVPPAFPFGGSRVEEDDGQWTLRFNRGRSPIGRCRFESLNVSPGTVAELHEASRVDSPFNDRLVARRGRSRTVVSLGGGERTVLHVDGTVERSAIDHDGARCCLIEDFGILLALAYRVQPGEPQDAPTRSPDHPSDER